jgi:hypothetical protein
MIFAIILLWSFILYFVSEKITYIFIITIVLTHIHLIANRVGESIFELYNTIKNILTVGAISGFIFNYFFT